MPTAEKLPRDRMYGAPLIGLRRGAVKRNFRSSTIHFGHPSSEEAALRWSRWHTEADIDEEKAWTWEQVKAAARGKRGRPPTPWPESVVSVTIAWAE